MRTLPVLGSTAIVMLAASSPALAKVEVFSTGLTGEAPRLASAKDGSLHVLYYAAGGLRHARLAAGSFTGDVLLPDSGTVSRAKYNRPSLDVGSDSIPHVVWGPAANWTDATTHSKGVWYWNGAATKQIFTDYTEYVALGVNGAGKKLFASAVVFLPGDTVGTGVASSELAGDVLGPFARFKMSDGEGKHVRFCKGEDGALHLVWRFQRVRYARHDGSAWSAVEGLGGAPPSSAELPSCAVDSKGRPHVAWLRWQDTGGGKWAPVDLRYAAKGTSGWAPDAEGAVIRTLAAGGTSPVVAVAGDAVLVAWSEGSTLWSRLSRDSGVTFEPAEAQATELDPGSDLSDNSPQLPLVVHEGKFQTVYARKDGTLARAVWALTTPSVDAGVDASSDTGSGVDASSVADVGGDVRSSEAGSDRELGDLDGGCGCRLVAARPAGAAWSLALVGLFALRRTRRAKGFTSRLPVPPIEVLAGSIARWARVRGRARNVPEVRGPAGTAS